MKTYCSLLIFVVLMACQQKQKPQPLPSTQTVETQFSERMRVFRISQDITSAQNYIDSLRQDPVYANSTEHMALLYRMRAFAAFTVRDMEIAGFYLDSARVLHGKDSSLRYEEMQLNATTAEFYYVKNEIEKSLQYAQESYRESKNEFPAMTEKYRALLIECFVAASDTANAMKYAREALSKSNDPLYTDQSASVIAYIFSLRNQEDSSLYYIRKANFPHQSMPPSLNLSRMLNAGMTMYMDGDKQQAQEFVKMSYEYAHEKNIMDAFVYRLYAQVKNEQGKQHAGMQLLDSGITIGIQQHKYEDVSDLLIAKAHQLHATGNNKAILLMDSAIRYKSLADSFANRQAIQELETKYEVSEKDEEIKHLAEKEASATQIKHLQTAVILVIFVTLIMATVFLRTKAKRRKVGLMIKELNLLQRIRRSQIDSHFWISSLIAIQGEIEAGKNKSALFYLKRFARLATVNMRNSSHDKTSLADEIDGITSYLELQKVINNGKFDFTITNQIDLQRRHISITPMLLQPFVENAVVHGMATVASGGKITILIREEDDMLICSIEDNGGGLYKRAIRGGKPSASTTITEDRLQILTRLSGRIASLKVEEILPPGNGVRATIMIPYAEGWQQNTGMSMSA